MKQNKIKGDTAFFLLFKVTFWSETIFFSSAVVVQNATDTSNIYGEYNLDVKQNLYVPIYTSV